MTKYNIFSPLSQSLDIIARHERGKDVSNVSQERLSEIEQTMELERSFFGTHGIVRDMKWMISEIKRLQAKEAENNRHKRALRKIVCLNVPIPDEVFNLANDALEGADTQ